MTTRLNSRRKWYTVKKRNSSDYFSTSLLYLPMITIYTKDYCPYCIKAKNLLTSLGAAYEEIDITGTPEIIMELAKKSGMRTLPQIFVGDECL